MKSIILLGMPGSGKGTQGATLCCQMNLAHLATGDLFREAMRAGTGLGEKFKEYALRGELLPDEVVCGLVKEWMVKIGKSRDGVLFDGFPRTLAQAEALEDMIVELGWDPGFALLLTVDEGEVIRRLAGRRTCPACGKVFNTEMLSESDKCESCRKSFVLRDDDREEVVRRRLDVYREETAPVANFYRVRGLLKEVVGVGSLAEVHDRIMITLRGQND